MNNEEKKEMTFEQKVASVKETLHQYEMGFITTFECIGRIKSLPWNSLESHAISMTIEKSLSFNYEAFKLTLL